MTEFKGTFDLVDSKDMDKFARVALGNIISRVVFRTGMVERVLFDLLAKTKCQIVASVDDVSADDVGVMRRSKIWKAQANAFTWTLSVSSANAPNPPPDAPPSPTRSKRKTDDIVIAIKVNFKVGDDFLVNIPITGEKVNSKIKRSSKSRSGILEQTTYLTNGIIHTSYNINKDILVVNWTHKTTGTTASQTFRRMAQKDDSSEGSFKSSSSRRSKSPLSSIKSLKTKKQPDAS